MNAPELQDWKRRLQIENCPHRPNPLDRSLIAPDCIAIPRKEKNGNDSEFLNEALETPTLGTICDRRHTKPSQKAQKVQSRMNKVNNLRAEAESAPNFGHKQAECTVHTLRTGPRSAVAWFPCVGQELGPSKVAPPPQLASVSNAKSGRKQQCRV